MNKSTRFCGSSLPARSTATSPSASPSSLRFASSARARIREVGPVVDHVNRVSTYAEALQLGNLAIAHRDDCVRQRQDAAQQQPSPRSQRKAIRTVPVGDPLGRSPPGGEHPEAVRARRAGHDHVGVRGPQRSQRGNGGAPSAVGEAGDGNSSALENRKELTATVERDQADLDPEVTEPRQQDRPVALGAPALQVGAQEDRLHRPASSA